MASSLVSVDNEKLQGEVTGIAVLKAISPNNKKIRDDVKHLLEYWHDDILDNTNLRQGKILGLFKKRNGFNFEEWRLDAQENGPFVKFKDDPNTKYQNFAAQLGASVYSCVIAPLGQNPRPEHSLITEAFNRSMQDLKVAVIKRAGNTWEIVMEN